MIDLYTVSISWWDVFDSLSSPGWFIRHSVLGKFLSIILMLSSFKHSIGYLEEDIFFPIRGIEPLAIITIQVFSIFSYIFSVLNCLITNGYIV